MTVSKATTHGEIQITCDAVTLQAGPLNSWEIKNNLRVELMAQDGTLLEKECIEDEVSVFVTKFTQKSN